VTLPKPSAPNELAAQLDAIREILRAISASPFDLDGILGIVAERMTELCRADLAAIYVPSKEGFYRSVATVSMSAEGVTWIREHETELTPGTMVGRVVLSGDVVQMEDALNDPTYTWQAGRQAVGFRTLLGVPIRKESRIIGVATLGRNDVRPFDQSEIDLVRTFADQAAIVIESVRLLGTIQSQREELARYLPSTVAELVSSADGEKLLAGHRREVTCVFCDLRGFTSFAEAAEPEEVLDILREYHRELGAIIVAHGGTLEHFAGDGMMIFLNDPRPIEDHPTEGVRMAVEMRDRFVALSERWRRLGFDLGLGIGVSVGFATLGRIGFDGHLGYAVVGSVANLAARLCAVAEPGQIILSERLYARVDSIATATSLGALELKGFRRPVEAYSLSDLA
jgi:adenylate cyclase